MTTLKPGEHLREPSATSAASPLLNSLADSTGSLEQEVIADAGGTLTAANGQAVQLPATQSLTAVQAQQQLAQAGQLIPELLNKNQNILNQANQAVELKDGLTEVYRNSMEDPEASAQLSITDPTETFAQAVQNESAKYAGSALDQKIIQYAEQGTNYQTLSSPGRCFIAGTLVHAKGGLVPIEKIRIGDWVLSKPEMGGEPSYKRVTNTFCYDDNKIVLVQFVKDDDEESDIETVGVTPEHPFWVKGIGWCAASGLYSDAINEQRLELHNGSDALLLCSRLVYKSAPVREGVGWAEALWGVEIGPGAGSEIDFNGEGIEIRDDKIYYPYEVHEGEDGEPVIGSLGDEKNPEFRTRVYNLEVEEFHTYFVGRLGVWVHNTGCAGNTNTVA